MAKDRALDRHRTVNYPYRPTPPELLERLDEAVGRGRRSQVISELLSRLLDGRPMPTLSELSVEPDKTDATTPSNRPKGTR